MRKRHSCVGPYLRDPKKGDPTKAQHLTLRMSLYYPMHAKKKNMIVFNQNLDVLRLIVLDMNVDI